MLEKPGDWIPLALKTAGEELNRRGVNVPPDGGGGHPVGEGKSENESKGMPIDQQFAHAGEQILEVLMEDGETVIFPDIPALRESILGGSTTKDLRIRSVAVDANGKGTEGEWTTVEKFGVSNSELRGLYRSVWHSTMKYAGYGAIVGIVIKALDTTATMFSVDGTLGVVWLAVVASLFLSKKWPIAPIMVIFFSFKLGIKANLFIAALTTAAVGAAFGTPLGMIVGTVVGHFKAPSLPKAPDASPESWRSYNLGLVLPILTLAVMVPLYLWLNVKLLEWFEQG
jgi:hypothetical protein